MMTKIIIIALLMMWAHLQQSMSHYRCLHAPKQGLATSVMDYTAEQNHRRFYYETVIKLCKKWGIPYLDLWEGSYLCTMNPAHNTANTNLMYVGDHQHLAKKGYDYITPMIEEWMKTL